MFYQIKNDGILSDKNIMAFTLIGCLKVKKNNTFDIFNQIILHHMSECNESVHYFFSLSLKI